MPLESAIDDDCVDTLEAYESDVVHTLGEQKESLEFAYFRVPPKVVDDARIAAGGTSPRPIRWFGPGLSLFPRYFFRSSKRPDGLPIYQLTYVQSVTRTTVSGVTMLGKVVITHGNRPIVTRTEKYPNSPLTNMAVAVLDGRSVGQFTFTPEYRQFVTDSSKPYSPSLLTALNENCVQLATGLLGQELDALGGDWVRRETREMVQTPQGVRPSKKLTFPFREPYFAPTLFETDVCRIAYRSFALAIMPYRNATIVVLYYSTSTVFSKEGAVVETKLWLTDALRLVDAVRDAMAAPGHTEKSPDLAEQHLYWSAVGMVRTRLEKLPMFMKLKVEEPNLPVLPFEYALRQVDEQSQ